MILDYFRLAIQSIANRKLRSWLTMIGIFIGIAAVISLIGLGEGLRTAITSQFGFLGSDVISVQATGLGFAGPPGTGATEPLTDDLPKKIARIDGVEAAFGRKISSIQVEFNDNQKLGFIGTVPGGENRKIIEMMLNLKTDYGRLLEDKDSNGIIVGNDYAVEKKMFGRVVSSGDKLILSGKQFQVVGILEKKGSFIFDSIILINEDAYDNLLDADDGTYDLIAVKVKDEKEIPKIREDIEKLLRKERNVKKGEENFEVSTPSQTLDALDSSLFAVTLFVYVIATISLLVGGIGILNTMYTAVIERTKEIGIMKAIGSTNQTIFALFFIEAGIMGLLGGIIGILLGLGIAYGLASVGRAFLGSDFIQAYVSLEIIIGSLLFSFILGTLFGTLPAMKAAKLHPVEALRSK